MNDVNIQVRVTNGNDFDLDDRFDGLPVTFPAGETVTIPFPMAVHIFAYDGSPEPNAAAMFDYVSRRWGWNTAELTKSGEAKEWFAKITIAPVVFELVERPLGEDEDETETVDQTADTSAPAAPAASPRSRRAAAPAGDQA